MLSALRPEVVPFLPVMDFNARPELPRVQTGARANFGLRFRKGKGKGKAKGKGQADN